MKRAVIATAAALTIAACSSSGGTSTGGLSGSITVYAASSLTEAFNTLKASFTKAHPGTTVNIVYGASSDLATQIWQGATADAFASASATNMRDLQSMPVAPANFVSNTLEIAVPPDNPANISSVADLAESGVKVAVCDAAVPCGVVAQQVFRIAHVSVHPTASLSDVKSTLAAVESGEVDAGLVYVTDVRAAGSQVIGVPIPADVDASTIYRIAALKQSTNPALAGAFIAYVRSSVGMNVLTADGFTSP